MSRRLNSAIVGALISGAEATLLFILLAELSGGFQRTPISWLALWLLAILAYVLPMSIEALPRTAYVAVLTAAIAASMLWLIHSEAFPHVDLFSPGWITDAVRSTLGESVGSRADILLLGLAIVAVWWRQLARNPAGAEAATALFRYGPLPVLGLLVVALFEWGTQGGEMQTLVSYVVGFFIFTLLASSYTRWVENTHGSATRMASVLTWLLTTLLPIAAVGAAVTAVSVALFGQAFPLLRWALDAVLMLISLLAFVVGVIVGAAVWLVFQLLILLAPRHGQRTRPQGPPSDTINHLPHPTVHVYHLPEPILWLLVAAALLAALWGLSKLRPRREIHAGEEVERESVGPDLTDGIRALGRRLLGPGHRRPTDPLQAMLRDPLWRYTAEIRRAYRRAQSAYQRVELGRERGQTPLEFAEARVSEPLSELTAIYHVARYSGKPSGESDAVRARQLVAVIESELKSRVA